MKSNNFKHTKLTEMTVVMHSQKENNLQVLRGKVLLSKEEKLLHFMQNNPQGPRSTEKMRTEHSRLVQTPRGSFTLTFRFLPDEKDLKAALMSEMERIIDNSIINRKEKMV